MPLTLTRAFLAEDVGQSWGPDLSDTDRAFVVALEKRAKEAGFLAISFEPVVDDDWLIEAMRRSVRARLGRKLVITILVSADVRADERAADMVCSLLSETYEIHLIGRMQNEIRTHRDMGIDGRVGA